MQAMVDEPNDMWAAAMVVYQTIISADAKGLKDHGDWMFGPTAQQYTPDCHYTISVITSHPQTQSYRVCA